MKWLPTRIAIVVTSPDDLCVSFWSRLHFRQFAMIYPGTYAMKYLRHHYSLFAFTIIIHVSCWLAYFEEWSQIVGNEGGELCPTSCVSSQSHAQYNTIQYNTIQYNTIQYNTIRSLPLIYAILQNLQSYVLTGICLDLKQCLIDLGRSGAR